MKERTITPHGLDILATIPMPKRKGWRIGIIGFGGISCAHVPAYKSAGWTIAAVADTSPAARERARESGVERVYEDYHDLIADEQVEVISLLTQPTLREAVVKAAVRAGKPVQTEKPLGLTLEECERIVETAASAGVPVAVNQNYRYMPANFLARQIVAKGLIGAPFFAAIEIHGRQDVALGAHPYYSKCADFLTIQWNTHLADLLRYWTGKDPRHVFARGGRMNGQSFASDNLLVSIVDFGEGTTGHILHNELLRSPLTASRARVDGDKGSVVFDLFGSELAISSTELGEGVHKLDTSGTLFLNSFCGPMADLLISIEEKREPSISARRNLASIRQVLAEHHSVLSGGKWIDL